jgi:alanine dehydrogenase
VVGTNAAKIAAGLGARVQIVDVNLERLRYLDDVAPKNVSTIMSNPANIRKAIAAADLVVGAVLIPGAKAPRLITREMLMLMKKGSVIVDVAVDQGGCVETIHPTTHENPTYEVDGIVHYGVANMPGAVPMTSTVALTNATLPYAIQIANNGFPKCVQESSAIAMGVNIVHGQVTYKSVAEAFSLPYVPLEDVL